MQAKSLSQKQPMKIAIVIPCYNEEKRFMVDSFWEFYHKNDYTYCLVNDGSKDKTGEFLLNLQKGKEDRIKVINRQENKGKAESVREGMLHCIKEEDYDWVGFFDADFSTPLKELEPMIDLTKKHSKLNMVIGSRFKRMGGDIQRRMVRFYIGRVFATITANLLKLPIYDTQCGAKIFKGNTVLPLFDKPFLSSWLFDVEILFRYIKIHGTPKTIDTVVEYPLSQWIEIPGSKIKFTDFLVLPLQLFKLYFHYKKK